MVPSGLLEALSCRASCLALAVGQRLIPHRLRAKAPFPLGAPAPGVEPGFAAVSSNDYHQGQRLMDNVPPEITTYSRLNQNAGQAALSRSLSCFQLIRQSRGLLTHRCLDSPLHTAFRPPDARADRRHGTFHTQPRLTRSPVMAEANHTHPELIRPSRPLTRLGQS